MAAKLLYRDAQGRDAAVDLAETGAFLGRAVECIVRTDDAMVSRRNCKISAQGGRWQVEDLNSANGTFINERRIVRDGLSHGDVIRCGSLQVRFVEVQDTAQAMQPIQIRPTVPPPSQGAAQGVSGESAKTTGAPIIQKEKAAVADVEDATRAIPGDKPLVEMGVIKISTAELAKAQEEIKKLGVELETLSAAAAEAKSERDAAVQKLESTEQEQKRLRNEAAAAKDAIEKLRRSAKQNEEELAAENRVSEELRHELKQLKTDLAQLKTQSDELRTQVEGKDRQLASAQDDVRRSKQQVDSLNQKLIEVARARDEQVRAINSQRGDVDHLRDILKERERMLEEQRVGLINQESQIKDLRKRAEDVEREFAGIRGERDNLRERHQRASVQVEELRSELDRVHQMLAGSQDGGEQLLHLTRENAALRDQMAQANEEIGKQHEQLQKVVADLSEMSKQRDRLSEERKNAQAKLQQAVEQSVSQAVTELKARHEGEKSQLTADLEVVRGELRELRSQSERDSGQSEQLTLELRAAREERDNLRARLAELEVALRAAQSVPVPEPAAPVGNPQAERQLTEMKQVATDAYDGINDALSELRMSIVMAQETFNKLERGLPDKEVAKKLRGAIDETMNRADEAKGHIRSLRSLIE